MSKLLSMEDIFFEAINEALVTIDTMGIDHPWWDNDTARSMAKSCVIISESLDNYQRLSKKELVKEVIGE